MTVAALYVATGGCYFGLDDVDPWDEARDARLYAGPDPVVAHPPCNRWSRWRYWCGPGARANLGDDGGCFRAALDAVRRCGGVLEHPALTHAWDHFHLNRPPNAAGWIPADFEGGWTCRVEQGHYGHPCAKPTWLYVVGVDPPPLEWGKCRARNAVDNQHSAHRIRTPLPFRDLLLDMARSVERSCGVAV